MKIQVLLIALLIFASCEKSIFQSGFEPTTTQVGEATELKSGVNADSYVWSVQTYYYDPNGSLPAIYETYYEESPVVKWDAPGQYEVYVTTVKNGQKRNHSGYVTVN